MPLYCHSFPNKRFGVIGPRYPKGLSLFSRNVSFGAVMKMNSISIPTIPSSIPEFVAMRNEVAISPEGGAAMFIVAMIVFDRDK